MSILINLNCKNLIIKFNMDKMTFLVKLLASILIKKIALPRANTTTASYAVRRYRGGVTMRKELVILVLALLALSIIPSVLSDDSGNDSGNDSGVGNVNNLSAWRDQARETRQQFRNQTWNESQTLREQNKGEWDALRGAQQEERQSLNKSNMTRGERQQLIRNDSQERQDLLKQHWDERRQLWAENKQEWLDLRENLREERKHILKETREQREALREQAKERYNEVRDQYNATREKLEEARQDCAENTTECHRVRTGEAKTFLLSSTEMVLSALNRVKSEILANTDLSNETKNDLLDEIDARIIEVESAKAVIGDLSANVTQEEVKNATETIREAWKETRVTLKWSVGYILNARLANILERTDDLSRRMHEARDRLAAKGKNVSSIDEKMADFDAKLAQAKAEWNIAEDIMNNATPTTVDEAAKQAHEHVVKAQQLLKEVRDDFQAVVREILTQNDRDLSVIPPPANATI
jgi:hypothetical protein